MIETISSIYRIRLLEIGHQAKQKPEPKKYQDIIPAIYRYLCQGKLYIGPLWPFVFGVLWKYLD